MLLGGVWKAMLYGKGYYYYFTTGLVKNTTLLPVEVVLTLLVLGLAERQGLDKKYLHKKISLINTYARKRKEDLKVIVILSI